MTQIKFSNYASNFEILIFTFNLNPKFNFFDSVIFQTLS